MCLDVFDFPLTLKWRIICKNATVVACHSLLYRWKCLNAYFHLLQLRKQFPSMNLKIPAKRIFGDNFDPGKRRIYAGILHIWHSYTTCTRQRPARSPAPDVKNIIMATSEFQNTIYRISIYSTEFIKQRRAGLHEFIKRIVSHPQLSNQWVYDFMLLFVNMSVMNRFGFVTCLVSNILDFLSVQMWGDSCRWIKCKVFPTPLRTKMTKYIFYIF